MLPCQITAIAVFRLAAFGALAVSSACADCRTALPMLASDTSGRDSPGTEPRTNGAADCRRQPIASYAPFPICLRPPASIAGPMACAVGRCLPAVRVAGVGQPDGVAVDAAAVVLTADGAGMVCVAGVQR